MSWNHLTPFKSELLEMGCGHLCFLKALLVSQVGCWINAIFFNENQRLLVVRDPRFRLHSSLYPHFHYKNESQTKKMFLASQYSHINYLSLYSQ